MGKMGGTELEPKECYQNSEKVYLERVLMDLQRAGNDESNLENLDQRKIPSI